MSSSKKKGKGAPPSYSKKVSKPDSHQQQPLTITKPSSSKSEGDEEKLKETTFSQNVAANDGGTSIESLSQTMQETSLCTSRLLDTDIADAKPIGDSVKSTGDNVQSVKPSTVGHRQSVDDAADTSERSVGANAQSVGDIKSTTDGENVTAVNKDNDPVIGAASAPKSKAQLRAERRAIQEAQRGQKAASKVGGTVQKEPVVKTVEAVQTRKAESASSPTVVKVTGGGKSQITGSGPVTVKKTDQPPAASGPKDAKIRVPDSMQIDDEKVVRRQTKKLDKQNVPKRPTAGQKKVSLFRHLVQYERNVDWTHDAQVEKRIIHKDIWKLGLQYMEGTICGSNARCIALLNAMKEVIADYKTPPNSEMSRELEVHIRPYIGFLNQCRQLSVSMGNAIKYVKHQITHLPADVTDAQAKQTLLQAIDDFIRVRIVLAGQAIADDVCCSIRNGDVILVYSCSSLVRKILQDAHKKEIQFSVIVVDGRPMLEGRVMLRRLVADGISCSYVLINSVSYVMQEVTMVLLGAHALLANGCVMSRVGSSQIALIAKAHNRPVLICCETYKFCERVQTDSFVFNELGDPNDLVTVDSGTLSGWRTLSPLHVLNLVYDVTPPDLLSNVITELGSIPCTSVPVVLRVKYSEA